MLAALLGILNFVSSAGFQALAGGVFKVIQDRSDVGLAEFQAAVGADRDTVLARITADTSAYQERIAAMKGFGLLQLLIFVAAAPAIYHQALVYLDSCPFFLLWPHVVGSWRVPPAPGLYGDHEWLIVSSILGIQTVAAGVGSFMRFLHK